MDRSRRKFLAQTLAFGCSAAASPFVTPVTLAAAPGDNRLVVIILRGGMDSLDVVAPLGDPLLRKSRPSFDFSKHGDLDGFFALNPNFADLMPLWRSGELGFAQAVSTPYRDKRSHFDGQDLLEAGLEGTNESGLRDSGWMNRMLSLMPDAKRETAFSVGRENMLVMRGAAPTTSWAPEGRLDLSPQAQLLLEVIYQKDPLFAEAGETAMTLAGQLSAMEAGGDLMGGTMSEGAMEDGEMSSRDIMKSMAKGNQAQAAEGLAQFAAARLNEETRFAAFSIGGWDTHQRQDRSIRRAMKNLQDAILTLKSDLGPNWDKTTVMCMTEFGRTARENGSKGTDHGTGGAMILAGGAVKGGKVYTDWPGLGRSDLYQGRDLMPTADLRRYVAWGVHDLFGVARSDLERSVFPGLDMLDNPGFIA